MIELEKELQEATEKRMEAAYDNIQLSDKFDEHLETQVAALPECNLVGVKPDGSDEYELLPFDYFKAVFTAFHFVNIYEKKQSEVNEKIERRAQLKAGEEVGYSLIVSK